jgi:hypothetical protein
MLPHDPKTPAVAATSTETAPVALAAAKPAQRTSAAEAQKAAELAATEQLTPTVEKAFIQAVEAGKREYDAGANDMAKGASRPHRKAALCSLFRDSGPANWTGTIADLSSNSDGKGVLAITIAPDVTFKTWSTSLSDIGDHTLIDPESAMYRQLVSMKKGDRVIFSGSFLPSDSDCIREASITQRGSMTDPEFIVRFTQVRSQQ